MFSARIKLTIGREPASGCFDSLLVLERRAASLDSTFSVSNTVGHNTPVDHVSDSKMELRSRPGVSGLPVKPQATSLVRKSAGLDKVDDVTNETLVNPPSSATGITRGGKSPSRILPAECGRIRTSSPEPRSESAGGADRSSEGDPPRRQGQTRESGDAGGRATPDRLNVPLAVAAIGGKPTQHPGRIYTIAPTATSVRCRWRRTF